MNDQPSPQQNHVWPEVAPFLEWQRAGDIAASTRKLRAYYLDRFAVDHPDPWQVTVDDMAVFLATPTWNGNTRKTVRQSLVAFYEWAVLTERIERNHARRLPRVRPPRRRPKPTPEETLERALEGASARDQQMILLGAYAGLRRSEIARLRVDDVRGQVLWIHGKGEVDRLVPIHSRLAEVLAVELLARDRGELGEGHRYGSPDTPWLFPGQFPGRPIGADAVGKILARCLWTHSGHTLRHRFGTVLLEKTNDFRAVQELMGHSNMNTTAGYTFVSEERLRRVVDAA